MSEYTEREKQAIKIIYRELTELGMKPLFAEIMTAVAVGMTRDELARADR